MRSFRPRSYRPTASTATSIWCLRTLARVPDCARRETDEADTDLDIILQNLLSGQYAYPVRIVSFNPVKGGRELPLPKSPTHWPSAQPTSTPRSHLRCKTSSRPTPQGASTCSKGGRHDVQRE